MPSLRKRSGYLAFGNVSSHPGLVLVIIPSQLTQGWEHNIPTSYFSSKFYTTITAVYKTTYCVELSRLDFPLHSEEPSPPHLGINSSIQGPVSMDLMDLVKPINIKKMVLDFWINSMKIHILTLKYSKTRLFISFHKPWNSSIQIPDWALALIYDKVEVID